MKRSKLITMAISLLAAICLWAYVVTVVNPDGDTIISGIPVTFSGQEVCVRTSSSSSRATIPTW